MAFLFPILRMSDVSCAYIRYMLTNNKQSQKLCLFRRHGCISYDKTSGKRHRMCNLCWWFNRCQSFAVRPHLLSEVYPEVEPEQSQWGESVLSDMPWRVRDSRRRDSCFAKERFHWETVGCEEVVHDSVSRWRGLWCMLWWKGQKGRESLEEGDGLLHRLSSKYVRTMLRISSEVPTFRAAQIEINRETNVDELLRKFPENMWQTCWQMHGNLLFPLQRGGVHDVLH